MLLRNKKEKDLNKGKWIGVGGKTEPNESADMCVRREVFEETGVTLTDYTFLGIIDFYAGVEQERMYLYEATGWDGEVCMDCPEGTLAWIPESEILSLDLWAGDRLFLKEMLQGRRPINMDLFYDNDTLTHHRIYPQRAHYLTSGMLSSKHAFSTRIGGVSSGVYSSLNLGFGRGDDFENVLLNYRIFGASCNVPLMTAVSGIQVHGNRVRTVTANDLYSFDHAPELIEADGYVTGQSGVPLVIYTADCVPVLLEDPTAGVIGAIHCGWRSTAADIMQNAIDAMLGLGAAGANIRLAIGPAICQNCFETGPEVVGSLRELLLSGKKAAHESYAQHAAPDYSVFFRKEPGKADKYLTDLRGVIRERFLQLGILPEHIDLLNECTMENPDLFWSHRATHGIRGSQANIIML